MNGSSRSVLVFCASFATFSCLRDLTEEEKRAFDDQQEGGDLQNGGRSTGVGGNRIILDDAATGGEGGAGASTAVPVERHGHLSVVGTQLVNDSGAPVQLKGISSQWLNWESDGYALNLEALIWMRDNWNLSLIRAAMGAESDAGGSYLDELDLVAGQLNMERQVETIVDNAVAAGVYVIIDFHSHTAHLHETEATGFFKKMSEKYGHLPNVLFEPFNEPKDPSPTEPLEWATIKSYHEQIVATIRDNDTDSNDNIVILGTPRWSQDVDDAAASPLEGVNLMYTLHFYSCTHTSGLLKVARKALSGGLPLFVTEWGATEADGGLGATPVCSVEADNWHDWMNENAVSWAAWKLDDCDGQSDPDTSCILKRDAPLEGGWTDADLNGHGAYLVEKLKN